MLLLRVSPHDTGSCHAAESGRLVLGVVAVVSRLLNQKTEKSRQSGAVKISVAEKTAATSSDEEL